MNSFYPALIRLKLLIHAVAVGRYVRTKFLLRTDVCQHEIADFQCCQFQKLSRLIW